MPSIGHQCASFCLPSPTHPRRAGPFLYTRRQTLCFHAYFKQAVHERADEHFRVRLCKIYFFPTDDTIEVIEPKVANSGLPQGKILRRQRIHKADGETPFDVRDLKLGAVVEFYGRAYKIYNCDEFTARFLTKLGLPVGEAEEPPQDPYSQKLAKEAADKQALRPYDKQDKLKQFLERDRQVLRFYGVWDVSTHRGSCGHRCCRAKLRGWGPPLCTSFARPSRTLIPRTSRLVVAQDTASEYGELRYLVVTYYLADDTVEITEAVQPNSGRDGSATFLKRCRLPKDSSAHVKQPGAVTARTLLNVTGRDGTHILDNLHQGSGAGDHYNDRDLEIGAELLVFNRPVMLCDCDEFTKQYYREHYGVEDFTPISMGADAGGAQEAPEPARKTVDPADSMSKLTFDTPKPDMKKWMQAGSSALQFKARLDTTNRIDMDREFVVSYYLADDTVSVFENEVRNSGITGGKFIERTKLWTPDNSRVLTPEDFAIDETVVLNRFRFVLTDASEFTFRFMEENGVSIDPVCHQTPHANPPPPLTRNASWTRPAKATWPFATVPAFIPLPAHGILVIAPSAADPNSTLFRPRPPDVVVLF